MSPPRPAPRPSGLTTERVSHTAWCRPSPRPRELPINHLEGVRVLATQEETALRAVGAAEADRLRDAGKRALVPATPVLEDRRPRILRRVACTERLGPAGVDHRVAVAPVEIAVRRPRWKRVQAAADVAAQVRPVGVRKRGNVDAADVLRRRLKEVRRARRGRARSAGREHENGAEQKCLHARIVLRTSAGRE